MPIFIGALVSSFFSAIHVLSLEPDGLKGVFKPRSCRANDHWYGFIPLLGYFLVGSSGKCRKCGSMVSKNHLLAEIICGIIFFLVLDLGLKLWLSIPLGILLIWMASEDFKNREVDYFALFFLGVALGVVVSFSASQLPMRLISVGVSLALFFLFFLFRRNSMGWADVIGAGFLGALVFPEDVPVAVLLLMVLGILWYAVISGGRIIKASRFRWRLVMIKIPLMPFIILGFLAVSWLEIKYGSLSFKWIFKLT